jgi:hypothetical protein
MYWTNNSYKRKMNYKNNTAEATESHLCHLHPSIIEL